MKDQQIIIKKIIKKGEGGGHGGQWKVAFADFMTAMMALFLLLWLVNMIAPEKRARVAHYFKSFSVFDQSGTSFNQMSSEIMSESGQTSQKVPAEKDEPFELTPEQIEESIKKTIEEQLADIKDQVLVDIFEGGVQIQLVDKEGKPMFDLGSAHPTPLAQRILQVIGENIKTLPNQVSLEGHTDSLAYRKTNYSNWELSTERALSARKLLEGYGLNPSRLTRVAGYADTVPLIKEDPRDPRNRRISIILLNPSKQRTLPPKPIT